MEHRQASGWNFHDGIVCYDPSEEFLNIKTQRLWKYHLMMAWFSIMSSYILKGKFGEEQLLSHNFNPTSPMTLRENSGNSMSMLCFLLMQWKDFFMSETACFKMVFLSFEGQKIFFCFVEQHSYFTSVWEKKSASCQWKDDIYKLYNHYNSSVQNFFQHLPSLRGFGFGD